MTIREIVTRKGRPSGQSSTGEEQRTIVSKVLRLVMDPWLDQIYYWLDLRTPPTPDAPKGHPNHGKVLSTVAFFFGLVGLAVFGQTVDRLCGGVERLLIVATKGAGPTLDVAALAQLVRACALTTAALLAYAALVFAMAFGIAGFRTWAMTRGGGAADALGRAAAAAMSSEVLARRQASEDGTYEATP